MPLLLTTVDGIGSVERVDLVGVAFALAAAPFFLGGMLPVSVASLLYVVPLLRLDVAEKKEIWKSTKGWRLDVV